MSDGQVSLCSGASEHTSMLSWRLSTRSRWRSRFGNLVDNALRHGEGDITIAASIADRRVVLTVADEGAGPPDDVRDRLFERFVRGGESRASGSGAGLGMPIVRAIARAHGGEARVVPSTTGFAVAVELPREGA